MEAPRFRLVRGTPRAAAAAPRLDAAQHRVVGHPGGPLLVRAGPGTGKTTTLVEAVVERIAKRGLPAEQVLVLTFSRKAATELRRRISARLGRTTREPVAFTFHSYAYALVRAAAVTAGDPPPRLLTGPEQLVEIRRLLEGEVEDGAAGWPDSLRPALLTQGFAEEVRDLMQRVTERGELAGGLAAMARAYDRPEWAAVAGFMERYAARFDVERARAYDYATLIGDATALLESPNPREVGARERARRRAVFVDEYQDTDPAQERLLTALAGNGGDLVAVGDADQSIYGFRGADVGCIERFPDTFRTVDRRPADVVDLRTCRRSGAGLLAVSRKVAARLPGGASPHRALTPAGGGPPDTAEVRLLPTREQEAAHVADVLRRAHLTDGVPWREMAVLVRSAVLQAPVLHRALAAAGVPVVVAGDEVPLVLEPAVRPLLLALRAATAPDTLDELTATELLSGPLGGADPLALRRLRRALRAVEADAGGSRPTDALLAAALRDERELTLLPAEVRRPAERVARLLARTAQAVRDGGTPEDALWTLWSGSGLAERWRHASLGTGGRARQAERDLDAVCALFDTAARYVDRLPHGGVASFLDDVGAQEIPGDTLGEQETRADAVRLLTAHRAKGLEWSLVVVAGVQEGVWPDVRMRGTLLGIEDFVEVASGNEPLTPSIAAKLLDEERRLFYVAVTRARQRLVATAVTGGVDGDEQPSRFLADLGVEPIEPAASGARPLTTPALVAELRAAVGDPARPEPERRTAATHLAALARAGARGAHPGEWYATTELSSDDPLFGPDDRITLSPSQVEGFCQCPLRWLLERAVGAQRTGSAQGVGSVVHALASLVTDDRYADGKALSERLDTAFEHLEFDSRWYARRRHADAAAMLDRLLDWHAANPRTLAAVETAFDVLTGRLRLRGRVDRVERDDDGRAYVVDLKTGKTAPADDALARHIQLGLYQLAVQLGAFDDLGMTEPGGAALVQLGRGKKVKEQRQQALSDDEEPRWPEELAQGVADGMSAARFAARANPYCGACAVRSSCPLQNEGGQVAP